MEFRPITIEDKKLFDSFFKKFPPNISELTFTNLFVWRNSKKHEFAVIDNHLLISSEKDRKRIFYQPVGEEPEKIIEKILNENPEYSFERVEKAIADKLRDKFKIEEQKDMFDYVYSVEELRELKGNRFEAKRNFIRQCLKYNPDVCRLDEDNVDDFFKLQQKWCDIRDCDKQPGLLAEDFAVKEALRHFKQFNLCGVCVRINHKIEAFALGERLNNNTYVEHFEKADTKFKGIYQFVLNEFAKVIPAEFLNREQDLGIEGLRKAKQSYNPVKMVEKYSISKE